MNEAQTNKDIQESFIYKCSLTKLKIKVTKLKIINLTEQLFLLIKLKKKVLSVLKNNFSIQFWIQTQV